MARMGRPGLSPAQKRDLWQRWKAGWSLSDIARFLGKKPGSIHGVLTSNGGFVPGTRTRSPRTLTLPEREEISRGLAAHQSFRQIALSLARPASTISREVKRHGGRDAYRASQADEQAWDWARRRKECCLAIHPRLRRLVASKLAQQWSPEQISNWLKLRFPGQESLQVSHETIYRSLFIQARGVLKKELMAHLRTRRKMRRSRLASKEAPCVRLLVAPIDPPAPGAMREPIGTIRTSIQRQGGGAIAATGERRAGRGVA